MAKLLITGITGFIGRNVLEAILDKDYKITAIIRPGTDKRRYSSFLGKIEIVEIDLADTGTLRDYLKEAVFDTILHIGALRGGRKQSKQSYYRSNVSSTEQMVEYCLRTRARLIFCSSVGVFGAIPEELPASQSTAKNADNYYHYTKIESEKLIGKAVLNGLNAAIIRPAITYGKGDYGFPYQMVKMVKGYRFPLIKKRIWIHLTHIETLVRAFSWCLQNYFESGLILNVADREPVELSALINFISRQVHGKNYPEILKFDQRYFAFGEKLSRLLKNELFVSRFELISKSWFYDVKDYYRIVEQGDEHAHYTIPDIQITIEDFLGR